MKYFRGNPSDRETKRKRNREIMGLRCDRYNGREAKYVVNCGNSLGYPWIFFLVLWEVFIILLFMVFVITDL